MDPVAAIPDIPIASLDDPRLASYRDVKTKRAEAREGKFIAEGHRVVERLLASRYPVESILATDRRRHLLDRVDLRGAPVLLLPEDLASELVGYQFHGGIMACGTRLPGPAIGDLFPPATDAAADSVPVELVVVCPRITDPDNLGGLMRLCRAFGAAALVVGPPSVDPFSRRVLRVSMGNAFHLPIVQPTDLGGTLSDLKAAGFELAATLLDPAAVPLATMARPRRLALLLGNEADGLEPEWAERCDHKVLIPMALGTDSLNVTVSAGIFLYHFTQVAVQFPASGS
ncbi:TrmH family RNA methyltransferase [Planctomyces sp. SH-PL14]|uniref:TrmH family RNA methyltransferase n=1 Tax=Planctomyces sp. SH-PL14 TaxID=1632864 RepID=UPI00078C632E|nr:RNA methyltransferase [Planctomyces sp. SH-PL14]AMV21295.1 Putative TrmH family tRNA/rRNA methyltransferase [Planctomyces sp. SH-PL14]